MPYFTAGVAFAGAAQTAAATKPRRASFRIRTGTLVERAAGLETDADVSAV
jgi:hypothetical protein